MSIFPNFEGTTPHGMTHIRPEEGGLSKRELFAAMAMHALIGSNDLAPRRKMHGDTMELPLANTAGIAVRYADELLAELEKEPQP